MQNKNNSLSVINEKYKGCNLLMPMSTSEQMSPFYKMTVMEVKADLSENSGDVFKVGSKRKTMIGLIFFLPQSLS